MGNWRSAYIVGICPVDQVEALRKAIAEPDYRAPLAAYQDVGPLSAGMSLCGLNDWSGEVINAIGNLFERGYTPEDVKEHLERIAKAVPLLNVDVHLGGDHESKDCICTVELRRGVAQVITPGRVARIPEESKAQLEAKALSALAACRARAMRR